jgi:deoxyribonuclease-4
MRIGIAGFPIGCADSGPEGAADYLMKIGLEAEELQFVKNVWLKEEGAKELKEHLRGKKLELSIHGSYYVNFCNPEKFADSVARIASGGKTGSLAGATIIVFHPGFYGTLSQQEASAAVKKGVEALESALGKSIRIGLETTGRKSQFGNLEDLLALCPQTSAVPVMDFSHIHARDGGALKSKEDFLKIFEKLESAMPKYSKRPHCHFSGIEYGTSGERSHLPISSKEPDFSLLCRAVKEFGSDPTVICESPLLENDALKMKEIFQQEQRTAF